MNKLLLLSLVLGFGVSTSAAIAAETCDPVAEQAQVSALYPTADTLPENLLRFYVYFSKPMQREDILSSVYLTDGKGNRIEGVFLDNRFDLWSPDSRRLTLLFDPGRVKTGLVAHNAMGRALTPGQGYKLVIDPSAKDAEGCGLASGFQKSFKATFADYEVPDVKHWEMSRPQRDSREALTVDMNGQMDHVSLAYRMRVFDENGLVVAGSIDLANHEQQWIFIPKQPWGQGDYQLTVDPVLEDIAGNRLTGLFDQPSLAKESQGQRQRVKILLSLVD